MENSNGPLVLGLVVVLLIGGFLCVRSGDNTLTLNGDGLRAGNPEALARATAVAQAAPLAGTATVQAINAGATVAVAEIKAKSTVVVANGQATAVVVLANANATSESHVLSLQATATAQPVALVEYAKREQNETAQQVLMTVGLVICLLGIFGIAVAAFLWIQSRTRLIYPNAAGQLPMVNTGWALQDPARSASGVLPQPRPDLLTEADRVASYIKSGGKELKPSTVPQVAPPQTVPLAADQQLALAQTALAQAAVVAQYQPGLTDEQRAKRSKSGTGAAIATALSSRVSLVPATPETAQGPEGMRVRQILARLGLQAPPQWRVETPEQNAATDQAAGDDASDFNLSELQGVVIGG